MTITIALVISWIAVYKDFVTDYKVFFLNPQNCVKLGNNKSSVIFSGKFKSDIQACESDFRNLKSEIKNNN